ncbi:MAG: hypothetical protein M3M85_04505 [bacterium]|nr:hypothetical protein [bacterium]
MPNQEQMGLPFGKKGLTPLEELVRRYKDNPLSLSADEHKLIEAITEQESERVPWRNNERK